MRRASRGLAVMVLVAALALSACSRTRVAYVDADAHYTTQQLQALLNQTSLGSVGDEPANRAPELRHEALVQLRSQGKAQSGAADVITKAFPAATASVPIYVERAEFDGAGSLILIEAWRDSRGRLSAKRLWVIDAESGEIRYSASSGSRR